MVNQVIHFVFGVVLARLLSPTEYGIIGMSMVFITFSEAIVNSGLEQALIRKQDCTEDDYNTMFYTNIGLGIVMFALLYFAAGAIARFYNNSELILVVRIMSLNLVINSFGIVERAILTRNIDFKRQTKINAWSSSISGLIGVSMAFMGFGYWSLAIKMISQNLIRVLLLHLSSVWKPTLSYSVSAFKELFSFGSRMLGSSILHSIYTNIYSLVIGKYFSAAELGFYSRANQFKNLVSSNIESSTQRVTYPILSQIVDDEERVRTAYRKLIKLTFYISAIMLSLMLINAKEIVLILLGDKWSQSIPYLQILCLAGVLYPVRLINANVIKAKGRADLYLRVEVIRRIVCIPAIIVGVMLGMKALLWAMVFNSVLEYMANSLYSNKLLNYTISEQLLDILPTILCVPVMSAFSMTVGSLLTSNIIMSLMIKTFLFFSFVYISGRLLKTYEFWEIRTIIQEQIASILPIWLRERLRDIKSGQ
jgi:O-antigen/teichoic acid export membrane protein